MAALHAPALWAQWDIPPPELTTVRRRLHAFLEAYGEPDIDAILDMILVQLERSLEIINGLDPTAVQRIGRHDLAYGGDIARLSAMRASCCESRGLTAG